MKISNIYRPATLSATAIATLAAITMPGNLAKAAVVIAEDNFTYADGNLTGNGSAADTGWSGAWRATTGTPNVTGGVVNLPNNSRAARNLTTTIGGAADLGLIYELSFNMEIGTGGFNAFEARYNGDSDGNRVINMGKLAPDSTNQTMIIGTATIDFGDVTGINSFLTRIVFGATVGAQDTAQLFINGASQGAAVDIGTGFQFDRLGFGAFSSTVPSADNLLISQVPEPTSVALLGVFGGFALLRRKR